jgi:hypothetical protein
VTDQDRTRWVVIGVASLMVGAAAGLGFIMYKILVAETDGDDNDQSYRPIRRGDDNSRQDFSYPSDYIEDSYPSDYAEQTMPEHAYAGTTEFRKLVRQEQAIGRRQKAIRRKQRQRRRRAHDTLVDA